MVLVSYAWVLVFLDWHIYTASLGKWKRLRLCSLCLLCRYCCLQLFNLGRSFSIAWWLFMHILHSGTCVFWFLSGFYHFFDVKTAKRPKTWRKTQKHNANDQKQDANDQKKHATKNSRPETGVQSTKKKRESTTIWRWLGVFFQHTIKPGKSFLHHAHLFSIHKLWV